VENLSVTTRHVWVRGDIAYFEPEHVDRRFRKMLDYTEDTYPEGTVIGLDGDRLIVTCNQRRYRAQTVRITVPLTRVITEDDRESASLESHTRHYRQSGTPLRITRDIIDPVTGRVAFRKGGRAYGDPVTEWGTVFWQVRHLSTLNTWRLVDATDAEAYGIAR